MKVEEIEKIIDDLVKEVNNPLAKKWATIGFKAGIKIAKEYYNQKQAEIENEPKEPYFGWCDVEGCNNEGCSGGMAWNDTGYWTVCSKHSQDYRDGKSQPKMKQTAIDREESRDKKTGWLTKEEE